MICRSDLVVTRRGGAGLRACLAALLVASVSSACGLGEQDFGAVLVRASVALQPLPPQVAFTFVEAEPAPCDAALVDPTDDDGVYANIEETRNPPVQITDVQDDDVDGDGLVDETLHLFGKTDFARWSFIVFALDSVVVEQRVTLADLAATEIGRGCAELDVAQQEEQELLIVVRRPVPE